MSRKIDESVPKMARKTGDFIDNYRMGINRLKNGPQVEYAGIGSFDEIGSTGEKLENVYRSSKAKLMKAKQSLGKKVSIKPGVENEKLEGRIVGEGTGKLKVTPELENHIKYTDPTVPRKRGIGGAHNKQQLLTNDIQIVKTTPHPTLQGVETIEYQMPKLDKTGIPIPGEYKSGVPKVKTVYDPNIISDEVYMERGVQAANDALLKNPDGVLSREWVGYDDAGVKWRGYSDGNGNITSFYPEQ